MPPGNALWQVLCCCHLKRERKQPPPLPVAPARFRLIRIKQDPLRAIVQRFVLATLLLLIVTFITYFGRKGYVDNEHPDQLLTFIDSLYYATVTITTTGYGDYTPATRVGRSLAVAEALIGQLYLVTLVSLIVGNLGRTRRRGALRHGEAPVQED